MDIKISDIYSKFNNIDQFVLNDILMFVFDCNLTELFSRRDMILTNKNIIDIDIAVNSYLKHIPLARVFHRKRFCNLLFYISPFVFDPRPETQTLAEYIIQHHKPRSILDIGVGSGAILLSLLKNIPNSYGIGVDCSKYAIQNAKHNADSFNLTSASFVYSLAEIDQKFDVIVSNPPYIIGEIEYEAKFDPIISLYENKVYDQVINTKYMHNDSIIILEVPEYSLDYIVKLCAKQNLNVSNTIQIGEKMYLIEIRHSSIMVN